MTIEQLYNDALEMVNKLRIKRGQEPLTELSPGNLSDPQSCPIQQSLECYYAGHDYIKWVNIDSYPLTTFDYLDTPDVLSKFMTEFDDEHFPELIDEQYDTDADDEE